MKFESLTLIFLIKKKRKDKVVFVRYVDSFTSSLFQS
jgi:hypothetical protein